MLLFVFVVFRFFANLNAVFFSSIDVLKNKSIVNDYNKVVPKRMKMQPLNMVLSKKCGPDFKWI